MKSAADAFFGGLAWLLVMLAAGGWIANIVKLASMCCVASGMLVLRAFGIVVAPLGAILGFL